ncbi:MULTISPECIES: SsrA-binding protein SmpB [Aerococcus]|uniref:SsrA-binding protein SmpB n=1 Tax=Aerococcus TaxID=1375 RepID=UPI00227A3665|nr:MULTISPECIES: SsrA-binding protein SmpB [Aerococcus]MCY3035707.1 SsrA-binding protein SmpB [Aerococcus sp. Group 2]MCY3039841.1 SsrA-binding protein SmpB [Aerococcus sp. Group 2]MCY3040375.1 SsrA-binding protein SmpB [Aerococcus sp. Group 2]MCY3043299.1 SsrA-binding protein SmpB [Aerococcus sp. Group 2]MDK6519819.1 SsrA-binding protein SmpB [Aerococcus urinae]
MTKKKQDNVVATNRKANHDYIIEDTIEAGLVLTGTEIKSIRKGKVNLKDSFARVENGQVWVYGMHVSPFEQGNRFNPDPMRQRKLLLKKREINRLAKHVSQEGYAIIPLRMYIKRGFAKLLIGIGKGKKKYDKRQALKEKDMKRDIKRAMKEKY